MLLKLRVRNSALQKTKNHFKFSHFILEIAVKAGLKIFSLILVCACMCSQVYALPQTEPESDLFDHSQEISLFRDLELIEKIDRELNDALPFFYNYSFVGGYFTMPSARMPKTGSIGAGCARVSPYDVYGVNFQIFDRIELSANYRIYTGITEANFGHEGFGDDAERIGNVKIGLLVPEDGFPMLPEIAVGLEDFLGTKRFNSEYIVATKQLLDWNLELTLGWGRKRLKGFFGGAAWSPFRGTRIPVLKNLTFTAEYDAIDYKKHPHEHPSGRKVNSRINAGVNYVGWDSLQLTLSSIRGTDLAASASVRFPIGTTDGIFPKIDDPSKYASPVDLEPLGIHRPESELAHELAYAFADQGLDLYSAYITYDGNKNKLLWLKVVNNRYRLERVVRDRVIHVLAALTPSDVDTVLVVIEADAIPSQAYQFRNQDLQRWRQNQISDFELDTVAPMREASRPPSEYDAAKIFQRHKPIWSFTILPRFQSFFGSSSGKFKYNFSAVAAPEGYIFDEIYYRFQLSYSFFSSMHGLGNPDRNNPSKLPNVRTDTMKYFQEFTLSMEQAFLQKSWNLGKGFFVRAATGYFEPAYGGGALEFLWYPVDSSLAIGVEFATVMKRHYHGIKFTDKIRESKGGHLTYVPFVGIQCFLDLYYDFKPLNMDVLISAGRFLAKDLGVRTEVGRYFKSGLRFALWCTVTNGNDHVNGSLYFDKGFSFSMPLDIFMKQSSRNYIGYAMSAWLRDVGARASTGKRLYWSLEESRYNYH